MGGVEFLSLSTHLHAKRVYEMIGERCLPLVHVSEAGKLGGRPPEGVTEVMSTDSAVRLQAHEVIQDIHGCGVACACGVEIGRGVVVVAAVREGIGAEQGGLAAVVVGDKRASPPQDT